MNNLPPAFKDRVIGVHGQNGSDWLNSLPDLQKKLIQKWSLSDLQPLADLSYNYLASARDNAGTPLVLKIGVPHPELRSEIEALKIYNGNGAVNLIAADPDLGALLLERLIPGDDLRSVRDDQEATRIAASLMKRIWGPVPPGAEFPTAGDWCRGFKRYNDAHPAGGPLPAGLVNQAAGLAADLLKSSRDQILLHGDLHHMNILLGESGWTAIDPKGVIGEPAFEVGALLLNPVPDLLDQPDLLKVQAKRLEILAEILDEDRQRLAAWSFVRSVLSAIWSVEDGGDWNYSIEVARSMPTTR